MQDFVEGVDGFAYSSQSTNYDSLTFPLYAWASGTTGNTNVGEKTYGFWIDFSCLLAPGGPIFF